MENGHEQLKITGYGRAEYLLLRMRARYVEKICGRGMPRPCRFDPRSCRELDAQAELFAGMTVGVWSGRSFRPFGFRTGEVGEV